MVYRSGDIVYVLVKAECRVRSDTEVIDMIGVCYRLVINDDRWWCGMPATAGAGLLRRGKGNVSVSVLRTICELMLWRRR